MKRQNSLFSFLKKKSEPASLTTPRLLSFENLPSTPVATTPFRSEPTSLVTPRQLTFKNLPSTPVAKTPSKKRKADHCASVNKKRKIDNEYDRKHYWAMRL